MKESLLWSSRGRPSDQGAGAGLPWQRRVFRQSIVQRRAARLDSVQYTPGGGAKPIADVGQGDEAFLTEMLAQTRELLLADGENVAAGLTDVRCIACLSGTR